MHIFDYSFLDEGLLPAEIVNLTATITAFNAISDYLPFCIFLTAHILQDLSSFHVYAESYFH